MGLLVLVLLAAAAGEPATLVAKDFAFEPMDLEVGPGAEVIFRNAGEAPHTATGRNGSFNAEAVPGSETTFDAPTAFGVYPFVCAYHDNMKGNLSVVEKTEATDRTSPTGSTPGGGLGLLVLAGALAMVLRRG